MFCLAKPLVCHVSGTSESCTPRYQGLNLIQCCLCATATSRTIAGGAAATVLLQGELQSLISCTVGPDMCYHTSRIKQKRTSSPTKFHSLSKFAIGAVVVVLLLVEVPHTNLQGCTMVGQLHWQLRQLLAVAHCRQYPCLPFQRNLDGTCQT